LNIERHPVALCPWQFRPFKGQLPSKVPALVELHSQDVDLPTWVQVIFGMYLSHHRESQTNHGHHGDNGDHVKTDCRAAISKA